MLKKNFSTAWRRLVKDRQFTLLNIIGLSTGLACTILIYSWTTDELQVDKYNTKDSQLYQVLLNSASGDGHETTTGDHTPGLLAATLLKEMPEVTASTSIIAPSWHDKKGILTTGQATATTNAWFVGKDFFDVFSLPLIAGDKAGVLRSNNDIVISTDLALQLFGTTADIIGKSLEWNHSGYSGLYRISGIFQKPPANATMQFDLAFKYDLFLDKNPKLLKWTNNDPSTYLILDNNADITAFNKKIAGMIKEKVGKSNSTLFAQRYSDRYLHGVYDNGQPAGGRIEYVRLFSIIAIFILVIACINFMNLSTAKAAGRIKEAGIKKIIGASRSSLIAQYLAESLLLAGIAALLAIGLAALVLPQFDHITGKQLRLPLNSTFIGTLIAITAITGIVSGSYPAFYLSAFKPVASLSGKHPGSAREGFIRKGLVVFQFTLSTLLIVSVLVVYRQMELVQTKNLGYTRANLLYFNKGGKVSDSSADYAPGGKYEASLLHLVQQVKNTPGVLAAANFGHNITNRDGGTSDVSWPGKDPDVRIDFTDLSIGYDFIETAGIKIAAGRCYSRSYGSENNAIIFNQAAIDVMGLKDPIGKTVRLWGTDRQIIGVVENFNFQSLHESIKPCFFDLGVNPWTSNIMVRLAPGAQQETIGRLQALYKAQSDGMPFEYTFLDDDYQHLYAAENRVAALSKYFAGLAILISCLGLFGLAAFTAQRRQKEIGIRKVIGAGVNNIVLLLSKDFLQLVAFALAIAFPLAAWGTTRWLHSFAYRIPLKADLFLLTAVAIVGITGLSISLQCVKAALANPIRALSSE